MLMRLALHQALAARKETQFKLLAFAIFIAFFSQTFILCLQQSLNHTYSHESAELIGADVIVDGSDPIQPALLASIQKLDLNQTSLVEFFSMVAKGENFQLANVTAVTAAFPLRGTMQVKTASGVQTHAKITAGKIWIDETLQNALNLKFNDEIQLGDKTFAVEGIVEQSPLGGRQGLNLAPIAYINLEDLEATNILQPGFRASFRLLIKGQTAELNQVSALMSAYPNYNLISSQKGLSSFKRVLDRVERYTALIILIQILLAAIVVGICTHHYSLRKSKSIAIWRCLGATRRQAMIVHLLMIGVFTLVILLVSILIAYVCATVILYFYQGAIAVHFDLKPALMSLSMGLILVLGFFLPGLMAAYHSSPYGALKAEVMRAPSTYWPIYLLTLVCVLGLFIVINPEWFFILRTTALFVVFLPLFYFVFDKSIAWARGFNSVGPIWLRFGLASFGRMKSLSLIQCVVFTVVVMLLVLIQIIKADFLKSFISELPHNTPNYFLINIPKEQVGSVQAWLKRNGFEDFEFYPIVRGRLVGVNQEQVSEFERHQGVSSGINRPINLTWMATIPKDNEVLAGKDWQQVAPGSLEISIEQGFSDRQHFKLGDILTFNIAEKTVQGKIVQIRKLHWESFRPNFFVIFPEKTLDDFAHTYITSVYIPKSQKPILAEFTKQFVEISIIDIDAILNRARTLIDKLAFALQGLLLLILCLGVLILYAGMLLSFKERLQESTILKMFGANQYFIRRIWLVEFGTMALIAGVFGSGFAYIAAYYLAHFYFDFSVQLNWIWFVVGLILSIVVITTLSLFGIRQLFRSTVIEFMQERR